MLFVNLRKLEDDIAASFCKSMTIYSLSRCSNKNVMFTDKTVRERYTVQSTQQFRDQYTGQVGTVADVQLNTLMMLMFIVNIVDFVDIVQVIFNCFW